MSLSITAANSSPSIDGHGTRFFARDPAFTPKHRSLRRKTPPRLVGVLLKMSLRLRYGLGDDNRHTLQEVGRIFRIFRVTRERIRQIEAKAIHKL